MLQVTETTRVEALAGNRADEVNEEPFVNEECGDTMWDMTMLNELTEALTNQHPETDEASGDKAQARKPSF